MLIEKEVTDLMTFDWLSLPKFTLDFLNIRSQSIYLQPKKSENTRGLKNSPSKTKFEEMLDR
jgi:hypothetical protein